MSEVRILKAEWMITRKCNLACSYCKIRDSRSLKGRPELTTEQLVATVKMFGELWPGAPMIVYGGEPTMRPDLPELLRAGREYGVKLPVISNSIRVMEEEGYAKKLVDAGLENWSVSLDSLDLRQCVDEHSHTKSINGYQALLMMRDEFGIRDLVACITVSKWNIKHLPVLLRTLTASGVHAIFTPLHIGDERYEYGRGEERDLPAQHQIVRSAADLGRMVSTGEYLCSNDPEWFDSWPEHFRAQDWRCNDKALLTIDADGSLRYCVDIPFRSEDLMFVWEMATPEGREKFSRITKKQLPCKGCLWNPAYECLRRANSPEIGIEEGRARSRHSVSKEKAEKLFAGAGKYFIDNPNLDRVGLSR